MGCTSPACACKSWNMIRDKSNNITEHIRARHPMLPENTQKTIISFHYKKEQTPRTHLRRTPPSNPPHCYSHNTEPTQSQSTSRLPMTSVGSLSYPQLTSAWRTSAAAYRRVVTSAVASVLEPQRKRSRGINSRGLCSDCILWVKEMSDCQTVIDYNTPAVTSQ
jgi:hypothetical protein